MKKKILVISVAIITLVLLLPKTIHLKDGGTIEYKALLYKITKYHQINERSESGYNDGIGIEILGLEIYNNVKNKPVNLIIEGNKSNKKIIMIDGKLYYETDKESTTIRCGNMDGKITSNVASNKIPTIDNQSNFDGNFGYQYGKENTVEVNMNNKWIIFEIRN